MESAPASACRAGDDALFGAKALLSEGPGQPVNAI